MLQKFTLGRRPVQGYSLPAAVPAASKTDCTPTQACIGQVLHVYI